MPFDVEPTEIPTVLLLRPRCYRDARGAFWETYKRSELERAGVTTDFSQDNTSQSRQGVLRGLHYQLSPAAQAKLVRCVVGRIWAVAVDLRPDSPTRHKWVSRVLDGDSQATLYVPPGFAHGFAALAEVSTVHYKVSAEYDPSLERGVRWNDPDLRIPWPLDQPILSDRDAGLPFLRASRESA